MKKWLSSLLCVILAVCMISSGVAVVSYAAQDDIAAASAAAVETRLKDNINGNSYNRYNSVARNFLRPTADGYMRVYGNDDGTLLAEYYDQSFHFVSNRIVKCGLPRFGGFFEYGDYYYVLTGDENREEDNGREVICITCFDKNWRERGYDSLYGANTVTTFEAGCADFAVYGDLLFIRTCHTMYAINGTNHQAAMTIVFDMKQRYIKDYFTDVDSIITSAFLSHSFNQFITVDSDGTVVCLDHGDSGSTRFPTRAAVLGRFLYKANNFIIYKYGYQTYEFTPILSYYGTNGDNYTAAMIGGLECSKDNYITVGASAGQDANYRTNAAYNAYVSVTPKKMKDDDMANATTKLTYLTSFKESDSRYASNPQLVKINDNKFLVMWNEFPVHTPTHYLVDVQRDYDETYLMKYVFIDGSGNLLTQIKTAPAGQGFYVTDCEPIVYNNKILWFVTDGADLAQIVEMDLSGNLSAHDGLIPDNAIVYPIDLSRVRVALRTFDPISSETQITGSNIDQYVLVFYNGRVLEKNKDYRLSANSTVSLDPNLNVVRRITLQLLTVDNRSFTPLYYAANWSVTENNLYLNPVERQSDGVHINVIAYRGIGYHIYRREARTNDPYELVGTVNDRFTQDFIDTTASRGKAYQYIVREFTYDINGNEVLSDATSPRTAPADPDYVPTEPPTTEPPTEAPPEPTTAPPTEPPTEPPVAQLIRLGDSDMDGSITILDATEIQRFLAGLTKAENISIVGADVDSDGQVSILDATYIQRYLAGLKTGYAINEWIRAIF